jgi:hypothetical protein
MKHVEIEYYEVYESYDRDYRMVARFTSFEDAIRLKQKSAYYGLNPKPKKTSVSVFESYEEYEKSTSEEALRKAALAKLTDQEKKLLGLTQ